MTEPLEIERKFLIEMPDRALLDRCGTAYVTKIDGEYPADCWFPNLDEDPDFEKVWESPVQEENGVTYRFTEYRRK